MKRHTWLVVWGITFVIFALGARLERPVLARALALLGLFMLVLALIIDRRGRMSSR